MSPVLLLCYFISDKSPWYFGILLLMMTSIVIYIDWPIRPDDDWCNDNSWLILTKYWPVSPYIPVSVTICDVRIRCYGLVTWFWLLLMIFHSMFSVLFLLLLLPFRPYLHTIRSIYSHLFDILFTYILHDDVPTIHIPPTCSGDVTPHRVPVPCVLTVWYGDVTTYSLFVDDLLMTIILWPIRWWRYYIVVAHYWLLHWKFVPAVFISFVHCYIFHSYTLLMVPFVTYIYSTTAMIPSLLSIPPSRIPLCFLFAFWYSVRWLRPFGISLPLLLPFCDILHLFGYICYLLFYVEQFILHFVSRICICCCCAFILIVVILLGILTFTVLMRWCILPLRLRIHSIGTLRCTRCFTCSEWTTRCILPFTYVCLFRFPILVICLLFIRFSFWYVVTFHFILLPFTCILVLHLFVVLLLCLIHHLFIPCYSFIYIYLHLLFDLFYYISSILYCYIYLFYHFLFYHSGYITTICYIHQYSFCSRYCSLIRWYICYLLLRRWL